MLLQRPVGRVKVLYLDVQRTVPILEKIMFLISSGLVFG